MTADKTTANPLAAQAPSVDIAIVGAGLVGAPVAQALSAQGWSVALLDAGDNASKAPVESEAMAQRCTALSLGTSRWFEAQGLWSGIAKDACAIRQVHVSHKGYFGSTRLSADEIGTDAVGYVVDNSVFNSVLLQQLDPASVRYIPNARVSRVSISPTAVAMEYGGQTLQAKLLIAADGVSSIVRESAGIDTRQVDYDQVAALGTVRLSGQHHNIAYERFTDSGPLALLPRPGPYMSFVDCMDPGERDDIASMIDSRYLRRLQQRFGFRLGKFDAVGPRFMTPLVRIEATRQVAERTILLGNAMRLLHPVGGQGYNLAMRDVAGLQKLLKAYQGDDPGNTALLEAFAQSRQGDQQQMVRFTDLLARGFRGKASVPAHARALGLLSLDILSPLRQQFARRTMGLN